MSVLEKVSLAAAAAFALFVLLRLLKSPLRTALRVGGNTALGFGALWLLELSSSLTGLHLGLNVFNALVIGVLGVPGFGLLLLVQWVLT